MTSVTQNIGEAATFISYYGAKVAAGGLVIENPAYAIDIHHHYGRFEQGYKVSVFHRASAAFVGFIADPEEN